MKGKNNFWNEEFKEGTQGQINTTANILRNIKY